MYLDCFVTVLSMVCKLVFVSILENFFEICCKLSKVLFLEKLVHKNSNIYEVFTY